MNGQLAFNRVQSNLVWLHLSFKNKTSTSPGSAEVSCLWVDDSFRQCSGSRKLVNSICRNCSSCYCFFGLPGIVSAVCSIALSKGSKLFICDLRGAVTWSQQVAVFSLSSPLKSTARIFRDNYLQGIIMFWGETDKYTLYIRYSAAVIHDWKCKCEIIQASKRRTLIYVLHSGWVGGVTPMHRLRHMPLVRVWFLTFPVPKVAQNSFQDFQDVDFDGS